MTRFYIHQSASHILEIIRSNKSLDFNWEKKIALVRFRSLIDIIVHIDMYIYIYTYDREVFPAASHRWIDGRIIVVVAVGEDQRDTSMRRLTLNKKKKNETGQVKEIFLASSSFFHSLVRSSRFLLFFCLLAVTECTAESKGFYEYKTNRCLCFLFFYVHAHLSLSLHTIRTTIIIDTLFLLF